MSGCQKITGIVKYKKKKILFEEMEQISEPDLDMAEILRSSDRGFNISMTNKLRVVMVKVENLQEWVDNINRQL